LLVLWKTIAKFCDFVGANFRHFVKNILSKDYSAANSVPFQIMGRKTIKILGKIWRNCLEHETALKNFLCSCCHKNLAIWIFFFFSLLNLSNLGHFVDEKSFCIGSKNYIFQFEICEISPKIKLKVVLPGVTGSLN
jgi:hypothetical protein